MSSEVHRLLRPMTASRSFFFTAPEITPRTEWDRHPAASAISAMVAPVSRSRRSVRKACLVPCAGLAAGRGRGSLPIGSDPVGFALPGGNGLAAHGRVRHRVFFRVSGGWVTAGAVTEAGPVQPVARDGAMRARFARGRSTAGATP